VRGGGGGALVRTTSLIPSMITFKRFESFTSGFLAALAIGSTQEVIRTTHRYCRSGGRTLDSQSSNMLKKAPLWMLLKCPSRSATFQEFSLPSVWAFRAN